MAVVTRRISVNFYRNLNANEMTTQVKRNALRAYSIPKNRMDDQYIPVDTNELRANTTTEIKQNKTSIKISTTWNQEYAKKRYFENQKNPDKTEWVEKGVRDTKDRLDQVMNEGVLR